MIISTSATKKLLIGLMLTISMQSHAGVSEYWNWLWESKTKVTLGIVCAVGAITAFAAWKFWSTRSNDTHGDDTDESGNGQRPIVEVSAPVAAHVQPTFSHTDQQSQPVAIIAQQQIEQVEKRSDNSGANTVVAAAAVASMTDTAGQVTAQAVEKQKSAEQVVHNNDRAPQAATVDTTLVEQLQPPVDQSTSSSSSSVAAATPIGMPLPIAATPVAMGATAETSASASLAVTTTSAATPSKTNEKIKKKKKKKIVSPSIGSVDSSYVQINAPANIASAGASSSSSSSNSTAAASAVGVSVKRNRRELRAAASSSNSSKSDSKSSYVAGKSASGKAKAKRKVADIKKLKKSVYELIGSSNQIVLGESCKHRFIEFLCMRSTIKNNPSVKGDFSVTDKHFITCRLKDHNNKKTTLGELEEKITVLVNKQAHLTFEKEEIFTFIDSNTIIQKALMELS